MQPTFEPDSVYFASGAYGSTVAKAALASPRKARDVLDGIGRKETESLAFGSIWDQWHTGDIGKIITRPSTYHDAKTGEEKPWHWASKVCKAWQADHAEYTVISSDDATRLRLMNNRIPPAILDRIQESDHQAVFRVNQGHFEAQCKVDLWQSSIMRDIKTTSAPLEQFASQAIKFGYHIQAGWYRWIVQELGGDLLPFEFIVTETMSPYRTMLFQPDAAWLEYGDSEAQRAVSILSHCARTGDWSDTRPHIHTLSLPHWLNKEG